MDAGRVSVIIPSYNYAQFLEAAVDSVLKQTYPHWEIAIVDDGSTDDTPRVAAALLERAPGRIRYHRRTNAGVSAARNFGIENTSGEFIMPLDADDALMPNAVEEFVKALRANPKAGYAFSNLENVNTLSGDLRVWEQGPFIRGRIVLENTAASASMWRRSLFLEGVRYRPLIFEDWDLWLQIVAKEYVGAYVPEPLFKYRLHVSGRTSRNRYLYFPALLQVMQHNPSLYDEGLITWAESCLAFSPDCWKKPTVVFLPLPGSEEYTNFSGPMAQLGEQFRARKHFTVSLGDYTAGNAPKPGLALLSLISHDLEAIYEKLGMVGSSLLVVSALPEWMNKGIRALKNVSELVPFETNASGAVAGVTRALRPFESGYLYSRGAVGLLGENSVTPGEVLTKGLLSSAETRAAGKKAKEDLFWGAMKRLNDVPSDNGAERWESLRSRTAVVISVKDPHLASLENCLSALRRADSAVKIVVSDCGSSEGIVQERLPALCAQYNASHVRHPTRVPFSRARVFNLVARALELDWIMLLPLEVMLAPQAFRSFALYAAESEARSVLVGEARYLPPLTELELLAPFEQLMVHSRFRPAVKTDYAFIPKAFLNEIGGLCEDLLGDSHDFEELDWRIKSEGARLVWLPRGQALSQWALQLLTVATEEKNGAVVHRMKQFPRRLGEGWGRLQEGEEQEFKALGPKCEVRERAFGPAEGLSLELRKKTMSAADRVACLVAWGRHCLVNAEYHSARSAFEDALGIEPQNLDVLVGLGHCAARRGGVAIMGHYASLVLKKAPNQSEALEMMAHLSKEKA